MECYSCKSEYTKDEIQSIVDKDGKPIFLCKYCSHCVNCEHEMQSEEIDEFNWILTKQPCFPSGWAFMTKKQLESFYEDSYELICNECATFKCNTCTEPKILSNGVKLIGMCTNLCETCGWACDDDECDCKK